MEKKIIEVKNYTFKYPDGREVLSNINFSVMQKECFGIIGANGAGKTTLLLSMVGILKGKGLIKIDGLILSEKTLKEIRKKVGFLFQDPDVQLFSPTVYEDVAFGPINLGLPPDIVKNKVEHALSKVGLSGFENRISHHLSIGEKRKVALAGILSMEPDMLLLDEPSSGLDPRARRELLKLLFNLEKTKIIATHDLDLVNILCDRLMILKKGIVVWIGKPSDILEKKKILEEYGL